MSRLTRDGTTAEPVSRDQIILSRELGQENVNFLCSAENGQKNWQSYPVDPSLLTVCIL